MKPLVALYKAYRGGEWFGPSLESVCMHCEGIVVVSSDAPWNSVAGDSHPPENCRAPLAKFQRNHPSCQVTLVQVGTRIDTPAQYRIGLDLIKILYGSNCGVLIVDTDEVWTDEWLIELRRAMTEDSESLYFRAGIYTYLRSPLYRVSPQERARPVVGLANPDVPTGDSRFGNLHALPQRVRDVDCDVHHFGYVRLDPEEIVSKLANTSSQDRSRTRSNWKSEVWDALPEGRDLHPVVGVEKNWERVDEVRSWAIPQTAYNSLTFWSTLCHHRFGIPETLLLGDDPSWRESTEKDQGGIETTVDGPLALCLSASGIASQDDCLFLAPRLRMSLRETIQLAKHARGVPPGGRALEIGSGLGGSLAVIGISAPAGTELTAVDPFEPYDEENVVLNRGVEEGSMDEFYRTIDRMRVRAKLLRAPSHEARGAFDKPLDLLLVDGNHSFAYAIRDLKDWWPLVKSGGIVLLHDLSGRFPGVVRAAREFEVYTGLKFNLPSFSSLAWLRKL